MTSSDLPEQIARIIDPDAWHDAMWAGYRSTQEELKTRSLARANKTLALVIAKVEKMRKPRPTSATVGLLMEEYVGFNNCIDSLKAKLGGGNG